MSVEVLVTYVITLPESRFKSFGSTPNTFVFDLWEYYQNLINKKNKINVLGVLPELLNLLSGSIYIYKYSH